MTTADRCCSVAPYYRIHREKIEEFKALCQRFVERTSREPGCLYYGFSFDGNEAHCREAYADADALLAHMENIGVLIQEALALAELTRLEIHGPKQELAKLREPLAPFTPRFFTLEYGFRR